jgi:hypothetical protein
LDFDHSFSYTSEEPLYYRNVTGLSLDLPVGFTIATFGLGEAVVFNEDNESVYETEYEEWRDGGRYKDWYMSTEAYAAWKIPTGLLLFDKAELVYSPSFSVEIKYQPGGDIGFLRSGPSAYFSHSLGFGVIDWMENFRSGTDVYISNSNSYNFYSEKWSSSMEISAIGHFPVTPFFTISGRLLYRLWFTSPSLSAADVLRGILDKSLPADNMLSLNLDFPLRLFRFMPSEWFNVPWLRFFNFEAHLSPVIDTALLHSPDDTIRFSFKDIQASAGLEAFIFPYFARSIFLRASFGINLRELFETRSFPGGDGRELFIGVGHYY